MKKNHFKKQFVVCIDNTGYEASLERGKIYQVLADTTGVQHGYLRIIDESGQDYLFDSGRFSSITISHRLEKALQMPPAKKSTRRTSSRVHA